MNLKPVRARLGSILAALSGIERTHTYTPRGLTAANCPQWVIVPGEAEYRLTHWDGAWASYSTVRAWRLILALAQEGQGAYGELEKGLTPFYERVEDGLAAALKLDGLAGVVRAYVDGDSGPSLIPYPTGSQTRWFGCEWSLGVESRLDIVIGTLSSAGSTVQARTASALEDVVGIRTVFPYLPRGLASSEAPAFLVVGDEAVHQAPFADGHSPSRTWRLLLLCGLAGQGSYGDVEQGLDPFFEEVPKALAGYLTLNDLSGVINATLVSDSGPGLIEYPPESGQDWVGCEWGWLVQEKRGVTRGV